MSPRRYSRIVPTLATGTALALVLAACSSSEPQPSPTEETSTPPPVTLKVPDGFNTQTPPWEPVTNLPLSEFIYTDISADGQFFGYAAVGNDSIRVGQINLVTGDRIGGQKVPRLSGVQEPELGGWADLHYTDNQLVLVQSGHTINKAKSARGSDYREAHLNVSIFEVGASSQPSTLTKDSPKKDTSFSRVDTTLNQLVFSDALPTAAPEDSTYYVVNADAATIETFPQGATGELEGCGGDDCTVPLKPVANVNGTVVSAFQEPTVGQRSDCGPLLQANHSSPQHCLDGFGAKGWHSYDAEVAPEGAYRRHADLIAAGSGVVIGQWGPDSSLSGDKSFFRVFDPSHPAETLAEFSCTIDYWSNFTGVVQKSGPYLFTGQLLVNTDTGEGACFDGDVSLTAVDSSGTAWGVNLVLAGEDSKKGLTETLGSYTTTGVTATIDGGMNPLDATAAIPRGFVDTDSGQLGVFAISGDELPNSTVVATYPPQG